MRASTTFVTMMVLNPVIILFYQNCSVLPARAGASPPVVSAEHRTPAQSEASSSVHASDDAKPATQANLPKAE